MCKDCIKSIIMIVLAVSCRSNTECSEVIDYGKLNLVDVMIEMEIGDSVEYLAGDLVVITVFSDGTILAADWQNFTIEQFNADGEHMATIANEGRGPGELSDYFRLSKGQNDTLIVRYLSMTQKIDFFSRGNDGIYKYIKSWIPERPKERAMVTIAPRSETEYYAREFWNNHQVRSMVADRTEYGWVPIAIVDAFEKVLVDSLHMLKTPASVARISNEGAITILGWPPYQFSDQFRVMKDNGYVIARPDSSALFIYTHNHELIKRIPLNVKNRPIKRSDLDFWFELRNVNDDVRRELEARVPDEKPVFLNIWVSENYFWLHVDINEDGKKMVVLTMEGESLGTFYLPLYDDIHDVKGNRLYTLHKNPESGHTIRIYKLSL